MLHPPLSRPRLSVTLSRRRLWLLEKNGEMSGEWVQRDLGGPGGVYWFFINNKRIDGVWRTVGQHAIATSLVD